MSEVRELVDERLRCYAEVSLCSTAFALSRQDVLPLYALKKSTIAFPQASSFSYLLFRVNFLQQTLHIRELSYRAHHVLHAIELARLLLSTREVM